MFCCPSCFSDGFLKDHINAESSSFGDCSFCKAKGQNLIDPAELYDRFEPLVGLYRGVREGSALNKLLHDDWNVFSFNRPRIQQRLLKLILGEPELFKTKFEPVFSINKTNIDQWESFREELKHNNRFFPKDAPKYEDIEPFGKYVGIVYDIGSTKLFRARKNRSGIPKDISEMGKPPKENATNGRANPHGIPYLYLASTIETAISENRGHKGETLTIAEFHVTSKLELADLRDPKSTISPFELNEEDELELLYKNIPFLTFLGNELSKPIIPNEANIEYLSSQYLCELFKLIGFHGIIYKSSVSKGHNYVIFDDSKLEAITTYQYKITDVVTKSRKL